MRTTIVAIIFFLLSGCSSMLLGGSSQGDHSPSTASGSQAPSAEDQQITASIRRQYDAVAALGDAGINVRTLNRIVTLEGTVSAYAIRDRAVEIASSTPGVTRVTNRLVVNTRS
ncbi:MAG: BON domain-containing protein [Gammaproteobacteria bacterium]